MAEEKSAQLGSSLEKHDIPLPTATTTVGPTADSPDASNPNPVVDEDEARKKSARPERTATFQDYLRIFKYATKWDFLAYAAGFFCAIGAGVTMPLMNVIFGRFVGNFSSFSIGGGQTPDDFRATINRLSLYMFALFIARWGAGSVNKFAFRMIGIRLSSAIRLHYLQRLFGQSIHVLDSMPPGYAVSTITSTSNVLQLGISEKLGVFVEFTSLIIAAIIVAFTWNWELALVTFSGVVFIVTAVGIILPLVLKVHAKQGRADAKAGAVSSEALASIRMIMASGAEARTSKRFAEHVAEAQKQALRLSPLISIQFALVFFGAFASFGLAFWYGTRMYAQNKIDNPGVVIVVLLSVMMIVFSMERISTPLLAIGKASVAACEFFTVIDAPQPNRGHLKEPDVRANDDIELSNVTFAYPSRPHVKILDDLDLTLEAGKLTAIVGPSGSGKSTIVGLIERWYTLRDQHVIAKAKEQEKQKKKKEEGSEEDDPPSIVEEEETGPPIALSGTVETSGHNLDEIDLTWWRSQIGLVQQEPFLFNDTIYKNVANGLNGSQWENEPEERKRELVKEACAEAFADEFIDKLPDRYDTLVGDSGARLSGGQRQRIAIARSIVRKPKILILDEATSAIDVRGERIVQAALDRVAKGRTTITIAHRLSTIKKADRIVVLKKGKVVESGTHDSLIASEGVYRGLVQAQALSLGEPSEADAETAEVHDEDDEDSLTRQKSEAQSALADHEKDDKAKNAKQRGLFSSFGLFFWESKNLWLLLALVVFFAACAGAAIPIQAWLFATSIDLFKYGNPPYPPGKLMDEASFWSLMWTVLAIGVCLAYLGSLAASTRISGTVRAKYQQQYFDSILFQKAAYFDHEDRSHGTLTSRVADDPKQLEELMGANMSMVYIALFNLTGSVIIALVFAWKLALVAICVVLPITLASSYWRLRYELQFAKMNNDVFADSSQFASESIGAFRTVTSLTLEEPICRRFEKLCRGHVVTAYKKARWVSIIFGLADSSTMACQALLFYYGGRLLLRGEIDLIAFFVCLMAVMNAGESAGNSLSFGPNAASVTASANRILDARESRLRDKHTDEHGISGGEGGMKIELRNVGFKYPSRDNPVFKNLSLTIEKGQFAALVGASGCGKTSIISLLERFYDINAGRILVNDVDITDVNIYAYRKHLSLVAQEPTLFQGTLRDNILLGVDGDSVTDAQLHAACRDASIHDFIVSLPEGYNTNIGSRGVSLSGGQKQRVSIARALIRNPQILLLDEATSSLDSESEKLVQAAFEKAGKGRTMVCVAHRLATVQNAHVIFVLGEGGKLLEKGNHVELLKKKGVYYQMCQSQALDR
ncbi:Multidrug resistance protein 1A-like protein [Emericellopsis cladophorae]|uniref:Multidrug resistance protein 1A-like protein n=1 Tax=Emericellopsis cladophorae TaxID=2686198 RepID=A0A9Q0BI03_9HYPO|nr:Multidrug resistance protein 1A-like protein [Emericellopsis cladophorae]KAI6785706.1 Multidrug resistance protein 1A-like protein [Emericellopsis cladophorae]